MLLVQSCKSLQIPLEISFQRLLPHVVVVVVVIGVAIVLMVVVINAAIVVVRVRIVPGGNMHL